MHRRALDGRDAPRRSVVERLGIEALAGVLEAFLVPVVPSVALHDASGSTYVHGGETGLQADPVLRPEWRAAGQQALATGAPVMLAGPDLSFHAAPIAADGATIGALSVAAAPSECAPLPHVLAAAARILAEMAARRTLEEAQARALDREQDARAEVEAAQQRLAFLYQASSVLFSAPPDPRGRLETLAQLVVPDVADWCVVDVCAGEEALERVAVSHWNPEGGPLAARLRVAAPASEGAALRVLRGGRAERMEVVDAGAGRDLVLARELAIRSAMVVPLQVGPQRLGVATFCFVESNRRYVQEDLALASDLARRAAVAVQGARLYQEAQRAIRARDELLAIVSHDLRNPLSAILTNAGMLGRKLPAGEDGERVRKRGESIRRSAERMNHLIRDLLDLARIESGRFQVEKAPHSVAGLVAEAGEMFAQLAANEQLSLVVEPPEPDVQVPCDRERVLQVLSNLLGNAIKFTQPGGTVRLEARVAEEQVEIAVRDTGKGIAPDHLPHVFDRYWHRGDGNREGTGLGLYIARGIVRAHGGTIDADGGLGTGSTFRFTLPREPR